MKTLHAHVWRSLGNLDVTSGDLAYSWLPPPLIHLVFVSQRAAGEPTGSSRVRRDWMYVQSLSARAFWDEVAGSEAVLVQPLLTVALAQ